MHHVSRLLVVLTVLTSCVDKKDGFIIEGYIAGIPDSTLIKLYNLRLEEYIDSAFTNNGEFVLEGKMEHPTSCWIRVNGKAVTIQVENVEMGFKSTIEDLGVHSEVTGGREQELQNTLNKLQKPYTERYLGAYDSLVNNLFSTEEEKLRLIKIFSESQQASHQVYIDFGLSNPDSYLGLDIIYRNRNSIQADLLKGIFEGLTPLYKQTEKAQAIRVYLYDELAEVGSPFIDFTAKTLEGNDFRLSSQQGKYIYLSFWNAGCGPCRLENQFFSKNKDSIPEDLSLVSFSIDKNINSWRKASEKDSISWINVSDYEGEIGSVKTRYGVQAIPSSFLIDKNGIIMKSFVGFDPDANIINELKKLIAEAK